MRAYFRNQVDMFFAFRYFSLFDSPYTKSKNTLRVGSKHQTCPGSILQGPNINTLPLIENFSAESQAKNNETGH
jgi:hypothetical protein